MGSSPLQSATRNILDWGMKTSKSKGRPKATDVFGSLTFNDQVQRQRLPRDTYKALRRTISQGLPLDPTLADVVAHLVLQP